MTTTYPRDAREQYERRTAQLCENDSQVRDAIPRADVREAAFRPGLSLAETVAAVRAGYADRPALGERAREIFTDPATGRTEVRLLQRFETISYGELWARATAVASEWHHDPHTPLRRGDFVATLGFVSSDYVAVELACIRLGAVSVPLQAGAAAGALKPIVEETGA